MSAIEVPNPLVLTLAIAFVIVIALATAFSRAGTSTRERDYEPKDYLLSALISAALALGFSIFLLPPLLISLFVPFPPLSDARQISGNIEVVGHEHPTRRGTAPPKYFIVTPVERVEFFCGLSGARKVCFFHGDEHHNGDRGTIWFHPLFGVLQYSLQPPDGENRAPIDLDYRTAKYLIQRHSYWDHAIGPGVWALASLYSLLKYRALRNKKRSQLARTPRTRIFDSTKGE